MTDADYLRLAYTEALRSPDPSTQNGAVLVSHCGDVIGLGHNRFAIGVKATPERLADRSQKYPRMTHAEEAAIWDAVRSGRSAELPDATLYAAWYACEKCAVAILESGVRKVVGHLQHPGVREPGSRWAAMVEVGLDMLREGGVACSYHDDRGEGLGCEPLRFDGRPWTP